MNAGCVEQRECRLRDSLGICVQGGGTADGSQASTGHANRRAQVKVTAHKTTSESAHFGNL